MSDECMVSCSKMTVWVKTKKLRNRSLIVDTSPITSRFIGQRFDRLIGWMASKFGAVEVFPL